MTQRKRAPQAEKNCLRIIMMIFRHDLLPAVRLHSYFHFRHESSFCADFFRFYFHGPRKIGICLFRQGHSVAISHLPGGRGDQRRSSCRRRRETKVPFPSWRSSASPTTRATRRPQGRHPRPCRGSSGPYPERAATPWFAAISSFSLCRSWCWPRVGTERVVLRQHSQRFGVDTGIP
jgi:hypothetical protein